MINSWQPTPKPDKRFAVYDKESGKMHPDALPTSRKKPLFGLAAEDPIFASADECSIYAIKQADKLAPAFSHLEEDSNPVVVKYTFD